MTRTPQEQIAPDVEVAVIGFLTREGMTPAELLRIGREEVDFYLWAGPVSASAS